MTPANPQRILLVRIGSMGDIVHALPAAAALRGALPGAQIDWLVERKWLPLLEGNPDVNQAIPLDPHSWGATARTVSQLRGARYAAAIDLQGLYKSALLAFLSGARRRIGYAREFARESGAALFYNERATPAAAHVVERNLELAAQLAGQPAKSAPRFPVQAAPDAQAWVERELTNRNTGDVYVISPGGGWRSKCWPAEQFGHLHRRFAARHKLRAVISYGPGEKSLAEAVRLVAGEPEPIVLGMDLRQLIALLARARFVVAADTGPLHLAAALGRPVVGLFGPTDPARNGPYSPRAVVIRNAVAADTTYKRGAEYSPAMVSIQVDQVLAAMERCLEMP